jgi:hypothetical protein
VSRNRHERLLLNLRILVHSPEIDLSYPKTCALLQSPEELILHISSVQIFLFHCIRLTKILAIQSNSASMEPRSDKTEQSYIALPHKEHCGGGEDTELTHRPYCQNKGHQPPSKFSRSSLRLLPCPLSPSFSSPRQHPYRGNRNLPTVEARGQKP